MFPEMGVSNQNGRFRDHKEHFSKKRARSLISQRSKYGDGHLDGRPYTGNMS